MMLAKRFTRFSSKIFFPSLFFFHKRSQEIDSESNDNGFYGYNLPAPTATPPRAVRLVFCQEGQSFTFPSCSKMKSVYVKLGRFTFVLPSDVRGSLCPTSICTKELRPGRRRRDSEDKH